MAVLNLLKILFLPLVSLVLLAFALDGPLSEYPNLGLFALIFGSLPTSAAPVVFAGLYGMSVDIVSSALPLGLMLAGPMMFTNAIVSQYFQSDNSRQLLATSAGYLQIWMFLPGLCCAVLFLMVFAFAGKEWRCFPRCFFLHFAVAVAIAAASHLAIVHSEVCTGNLVWYCLRTFSWNQVRLFGVTIQALWIAHHRLKMADWRTDYAALSMLYALPALLSFVTVFNHQVESESHFLYVSCLYAQGGSTQQLLDKSVCACGMLLAIANLIIYLRTQPENSVVKKPKPAAPLPEHKMTAGYRHKMIASHFCCNDINQEFVESINMASLATDKVKHIINETTEDKWYHEHHHKQMVSMSIYGTCMLMLDCALAVVADSKSTSSTAVVSIYSMSLHAIQGVILFLIFCDTQNALDVYAWIMEKAATLFRH